MSFIPSPMQIQVVAGESSDRSMATTRPEAKRFVNWALVKRLSRQPLIHFLLAGLAIFAVASVVDRTNASRSTTVRVSAAEVQRLEDVWSRQYGRHATPAELQNLIGDYIREEIYYREAIASGLDKDDTIIRRRLVEKMEFLSQEVAGGEPDEKELQSYFQRNQQKFEVPAEVAFTHIFFSPAKRGATAVGDARKALEILTSGAKAQVGDAFMLQSEYPLQTDEEVKALFGDEFAKRLFKVSPGHWQGPIPSSYGLHLVRITQFVPPHVPQLSEVRNQVVTEFKNERLQAASEAYYARLRERYRVEVDGAAVATAVSGQRTRPPVEKASPDED